MTQLSGLAKKKEEKEKNQKKKKKEKRPLKEKNTPFGSAKKEKVSIDLGLVGKRKSKQQNTWLEEVRVDQVEDWARTNLPYEVDLAWELGKFRDHWLASRNKPPLNGVAAFRNWLRNSIEFNKNRNFRRGYGKERTDKTTPHDRLFAANARIIARLNSIQLDRDEESMGDTLFATNTGYSERFNTLSAVNGS